MTATLERGFKARAERTSAGLRGELGLSEFDRLNPHQLAAYLDVRLLTPSDVPGVTTELLHQLLTVDPWGWSAVTIVQGNAALIIFNPRHSEGRQASDITHELAHIILGHQPATMIMSPDGSLVMRSYDQKQEDEANWLAWAILLPREALMIMKRRRASIVDIADAFGVTESLVQYRLRVTGIESQFRAMAARKSRWG
jgi:Zn-dependent peptidase ImmA (M78 family)